MRRAIGLIFVVACGGGGGGDSPDARRAIDAAIAIDAPLAPDAPAADAGPTICNGLAAGGTHKIFLAFEQEVIDVGTTDATTNHWIQANGVDTKPPWRAADPNRQASIAAIACAIRLALDTVDVEIVTTRPAAGDYQMVLLGGSPSVFGFSAGVPASGSPDCGNASHKDIGWVADSADPNREVADLALGVLGLSVGADGTHGDTSDCMCGWGGGGCIADLTAACAYHDGISTQGAVICSTGTMQDELALFTAAFGTRP